MIVKGFDDKEYAWTLKTSALGDENRSGLHLRARNLLQEIFPFDVVHEDVTLPGSKTFRRKSLLYADFFLPRRMLMVEVNGEQHSKHIKHFHKTKHEFLKAKLRDREKQQWCEMNGIRLVQLEYNQSIDEWRDIINNG